MKKSILFSLFIIFFYFNLNFAQYSDSTKYIAPKITILKHNININPLYLIFGLIDIGYEYRILNQISLEGNYGFGKLFFVEVQKYYEFGFRYYIKKQSNSSFFLKVHINNIGLKSDDKSADVLNYGLFIGHRWLISKSFTIDLYGGIYLSGDDKVIFEEVKGNTKKTVDIGGHTRTSGNIQIGLSF